VEDRPAMTATLVHRKGFRQLLDAAADAMLVVEERGNVVTVNPASERLFGWAETDLLGEPLNRIIPQRFQEAMEAQLPVCSINLSAPSLEDAGLVPAVHECLSEHRLPPQALCFEIPETAALESFARLVRLVSDVRTTGCGIGLDDFGGGLTSFAHLKALPVDYVKIGGHYVRGVVDDPVCGTVVGAVNRIGRLMGITTIAQQVESEPILEQLRALGVEYAQGHAVAPPAPLVGADGEVALPCVQRSA